MTDTIKINATELKKTFAYIDIEDLLYTMKRDIDFLASHNKNYTKQQYHKIQGLQEIIKQMKGV